VVGAGAGRAIPNGHNYSETRGRIMRLRRRTSCSEVPIVMMTSDLVDNADSTSLDWLIRTYLPLIGR
jgi:hypothetical protein